MKKKLTLVSHNQFGYQVSSYYYAYFLQHEYNIQYISFDENKPRIILDGVESLYLRKRGFILYRNLRFAWFVSKHINIQKSDNVILKYFPFCSLVALFSLKEIVLDIRTASVNKSFFVNILLNSFLRFESFFFPKKIILSHSLKQRLMFRKARVVPLGAFKKGYSIKKFNALNLIYIGTFNSRDIYKTIDGLKIFIDRHRGIEVDYTLIGDGKAEVINEITIRVEKYKLQNCVKLTGRLPHTNVGHWLKEANVGISFIPQTNYFDKQPPSKTYEYLLAGMPVLATSTFENKRVVNNKNGVLIFDNSYSFARGLWKIWENRNNWDSEVISKSVEEYNWGHIIDTKLKPYLKLKA